MIFWDRRLRTENELSSKIMIQPQNGSLLGSTNYLANAGEAHAYLLFFKMDSLSLRRSGILIHLDWPRPLQ